MQNIEVEPSALQADKTSPGLKSKQYQYQIVEHARKTSVKNSLFAGEQFEELAQFLWWNPERPIAHSFPASSSATNERLKPFALLYTLEEGNRSFPAPQPLTFPLPTLYAREQGEDSKVNGAIIFMRGYPSKDWLLEIGATYNVDPEFFRRHMSYLQTKPAMPIPTVLSSSQKTIFQLSITTLGFQDAQGYGSVNDKRKYASKSMCDYLKSLKTPGRWSCSDSVVRSYAAHDISEFSIQQVATITVNRHPSRRDRWLSLVWLDSGRSLSRSPKGPWLANNYKSSANFEPVALYRPHVSLKKHWDDDFALPDFRPDDLVQSIEVLPFVYGKSLNPTAASHDPFYALNELLTFTATSEMAFLSAVEHKLHHSIMPHLSKNTTAPLEIQADLVYYRQLLEAHILSISDTNQFIKSRIYLDWPRYNDRKVDSAATWIQNDFEQLLEKAQMLQRKCEREMDILLTYASLEEAKQTASQNERGLRLTILATFFIPLAFSGSLFGMNFVTFESRGEGLWVWTLVTIPIFLASLLVLTWNNAQIAKWRHNLTSGLTRNSTAPRKVV